MGKGTRQREQRRRRIRSDPGTAPAGAAFGLTATSTGLPAVAHIAGPAAANSETAPRTESPSRSPVRTPGPSRSITD